MSKPSKLEKMLTPGTRFKIYLIRNNNPCTIKEIKHIVRRGYPGDNGYIRFTLKEKEINWPGEYIIYNCDARLVHILEKPRIRNVSELMPLIVIVKATPCQ